MRTVKLHGARAGADRRRRRPASQFARSGVRRRGRLCRGDRDRGSRFSRAFLGSHKQRSSKGLELPVPLLLPFARCATCAHPLQSPTRSIKHDIQTGRLGARPAQTVCT